MSRCETGRQKLDERRQSLERIRIAPFDAPGVEAVQYDLAAEMSETGGQTSIYIGEYEMESHMEKVGSCGPSVRSKATIVPT